jgi:sialate O-acetylesterase
MPFTKNGTGSKQFESRLVERFSLDSGKAIRIACAGDSITYGEGTEDPELFSYPSQLAQLLGPLFEVRNYGVSGASIVKGIRPETDGWDPGYIRQQEFDHSIQDNPSIVVLNLGINDVVNESFDAVEFVRDYKELISAYQSLPANPEIFIWNQLAPLFPGHSYFGHARLNLIHSALSLVGEATGVHSIDMGTPLDGHADLFPDFIHPNSAGAALIAEVVFEALIQISVSG